MGGLDGIMAGFMGIATLAVASVADVIVSTLLYFVVDAIINAFAAINPSSGMALQSLELIRSFFALTDALGMLGFVCSLVGFVLLIIYGVMDMTRF